MFLFHIIRQMFVVLLMDLLSQGAVFIFSRNYAVIRRSTASCGTCSAPQLQMGTMPSSYPFALPLPEADAYVEYFITVNSETRKITDFVVTGGTGTWGAGGAMVITFAPALSAAVSNGDAYVIHTGTVRPLHISDVSAKVMVENYDCE